MSAFGLGSTGTNARTRLDQMPAAFWDLFQQYAGQSKDEDAYSRRLRDQHVADLTQRQQEGIGSTDYIRGLGESIMPGVGDAISRMRGRNAGVRGTWGGMPRAADTANEVSGALDQFGTGINSTGDAIAGDIGDTFNRTRGRTDNYGRAITGNISDVYGGLTGSNKDTYGRLGGDVSGTFAGLGGDVNGTFSGLGGATDTAYSDINKNLEQLRPGSQARAARVGRSFDPALASTAMRLRRFGIDPNSPEGNAAMQRVEVQRAASMDDSLATDTDRYVSQANASRLGQLDRNTQLGLGRLDRSTQLGLGRLDRSSELGREEAGIDRGLRLDQGNQFRNEQVRQDNTFRGLDMAQLDANTTNTNRTQDRSAEYWQQKMQLPQLLRSMGMQDLDIERMLNSDENSTDMNALNLLNQQYQQGLGYRSADLGYRDRAGDQIGQAGDDAFRRSDTYSGRGQGYANAAGQGWQNTYNREAANSNWLGKTLLGVGGAALGAFTGGLGTGLAGLGSRVAGGIAGGAAGGMGGRFGGGAGSNGSFSLFPNQSRPGGVAGNMGGGTGGIASALGLTNFRGRLVN